MYIHEREDVHSCLSVSYFSSPSEIRPIEIIMHGDEKEKIISCAPGKLISVMNAFHHLARIRASRTDRILSCSIYARQTLTRQLESLIIIEHIRWLCEIHHWATVGGSLTSIAFDLKTTFVTVAFSFFDTSVSRWLLQILLDDTLH